MSSFLPVTREEALSRGWDELDFVFVSGDAYVDHPSFGCAILTRVLEREGFRVAVLPQPDWRNAEDFTRFGRPKLAFLVSAGVLDSMVNHYTAAKKPRGEDAYSPGGQRGHRPDRATIVYCNRIREAYRDVPIVIGGVEASLRRFAHYDYWEDRVRRSILDDSGADVLLYGMGEKSIVEVARLLARGALQEGITSVAGACWMRPEKPEGFEELPSFEAVSGDKRAYARAFLAQYKAQDPVRGKPLAQAAGTRYLCQNPPAMPLSRAAMDRVYALPYARAWHPSYDAAGGVPALEEVKFSITGTRGCFGGCGFCSLHFHQGRVVTSRSPDSIAEEARLLVGLPGFKGYIHDIGGPTANFRAPACAKQRKEGACLDRQCLYPRPCKHMRPDHGEFIEILRRVRALPGVKKVFIRSGLRFDYILADAGSPFLRELCAHHVSGRLKVAPEHVSGKVLALMGKPDHEVYERFVQKFDATNAQLGLRQFVQPYLMSGHPGSDLPAAVELAEYLRDTRQQPEQVQDFYPTPGTLSTCMFYTGLDPRTMRPVHVPVLPREKALQRALLQYRRPQNRALVREALSLAGRDDLIGFGKKCLVPPAPAAPAAKR
ncbi:MAG: YgiQ family radical SAM protein, partial [Firmicutes bacterium]|nr:YgiQ family radical SAM protein [Bacillota bacterium]